MMNRTILTGVIALLFALTNVHAGNAEEVDLIVKNGIVLTMNAGNETFSGGVVIVDGNKIVAVGGAEILQKYSSDRVIDANGGIIIHERIQEFGRRRSRSIEQIYISARE